MSAFIIHTTTKIIQWVNLAYMGTDEEYWFEFAGSILKSGRYLGLLALMRLDSAGAGKAKIGRLGDEKLAHNFTVKDVRSGSSCLCIILM